jgi:hypothetical protein
VRWCVRDELVAVVVVRRAVVEVRVVAVLEVVTALELVAGLVVVVVVVVTAALELVVAVLAAGPDELVCVPLVVVEVPGAPPPQAASTTPAMTIAAASRDRIRFTPPASHTPAPAALQHARQRSSAQARRPIISLVTAPSEGARRDAAARALTAKQTAACAPVTEESNVR